MPTPLKRYISILNCDLCNKIPQKIDLDQERDKAVNLPPETSQLIPVLVLEDANTDRYSSSTTKLFKCPNCGTYYYYNHYTDDGHDFMDPKFNEIVFRRYTPSNVIYMLDRLVQGKGGALPHASGELQKVFIDNTPLNPTAPIDPHIEQNKIELEELQPRYEPLIQEFVHLLQTTTCPWQIQQYFIESISVHYLKHLNLKELMGILLQHANMEIRVISAYYILGILTDDAPIIDLIHLRFLNPTDMKKLLINMEFKELCLQIFRESAASYSELTWQYDHGYGVSRYFQQPLRLVAFHGFQVLSDHLDLSGIIPEIAAYLANVEDAHLRSSEAWLLHVIGTKKPAIIRLIWNLLKQMDITDNKKYPKDSSLANLILFCKKHLHIKKAKKTTQRKNKKTN